MFVVDKDTPGVRARARAALHAHVRPTTHAIVAFEDVRVPAVAT